MSQGLSLLHVFCLVRADAPDLDIARGLAVDVEDIGPGRIAPFHHVDDIAKLGFGLAPPFADVRRVEPAPEQRIMLFRHGLKGDVKLTSCGCWRNQIAQVLRKHAENDAAQRLPGDREHQHGAADDQDGKPEAFSDATPDHDRSCELA